MMNTEHAEQSQILTIGKTPAQWVEIMATHGIEISERTLSAKIDISPEQLAIVQGILKGHLPKGTLAWAFGSRVTWTAKPFSDLDIALEGAAPLIDLAKDVKASAARGEAEGLSDEELAFYDALAQNESAVEAMGNEQLRLIAHELLDQVRKNATVDWHKKESARARMRILVKRILKKYGYPPDLSTEAAQIVLEQAETLLKDL